MSSQAAAARSVEARGVRLTYSEAGPHDGEPVLLLHGLASDRSTWDRVQPLLAARGARVFALDLVGHGGSDKPRSSSYLLSDFAQSVAAFLDAVGVRAVTLCGHSLGGAIAVHFGVLYPERVRRLVLVSAGGLGREVHPVLRAATLPIAPRVVEALTGPRVRRVLSRPALHRALHLTPDNLINLRRAGRALGTADGRAAFFASARGVISPSGQRGNFIEMRALASHVPTLLVWNERDGVIPVAHARAAHAHLPGSRLVVLPGGGHEPHRRDADLFTTEVASFIASS